MSSVTNDFGIPNRAMVEGNVSSYADQIGRLELARKVTIKDDGSECTRMSFVFSLLALIAAGGAAALIACSGGPSNALVFYSGVALGACSVGLTAALAFVIVRSIKVRNALNSGIDKYLDGKVEFKDALAEMEKADSGQVQKILLTTTEAQRRNFMIYVQENYFSETNKQALTADQVKVISVVAQFWKEINSLENMNRDFALQVLASIDPAVIHAEDGKGKELIAKLFDKATPQVTAEGSVQRYDQNELKIYARHPEAITGLAQNKGETYTSALVQEIFDAMDVTQKTRFLKALSDDYDAYAAEKQDEKAKIQEYVGPCIKRAFTSDFVAIFKGPEPVEGEEKVKYDQAKEYLTQLARWPQECAECIYLEGSPELICTPRLVDSLYATLNESKKEFVTYAATKLPEDFNCAAIINDHAKNYNDMDLPEATQLIFARLPVAMAKSWIQLDDKGSAGLAGKYASAVVAKMDSDNQVRFHVSLLEAEKDLNKVKFDSRMTGMLKGMLKFSQETPQKITKSSTPLAYFKQRPEDFGNLVLKNKNLILDENKPIAKNKKISEEQAIRREEFGLILLEKMDNDSEAVVKKLDNGDFERLISRLEKQTKDLDQTAVDNFNETRARLIERFVFSDRVTKRRKTGLGPKIMTIAINSQNKRRQKETQI